LQELEDRRVPATLPAPAYFDFGTSSSATAAGYRRVAVTSYNSTQGFGWQKTARLSAVDQGTADALTRDFHQGKDSTFLVNVANGTYDITVSLGDAKALRDRMTIWIEGQQLASGLTTQAGQFLQRTFRVNVADGQLTLRIADSGGTNAYFAINALTVAPVRPTANAGPDRTTLEGTTVALAGSVSDGVGPFTTIGTSATARVPRARSPPATPTRTMAPIP
jgi:hypothetical protein